jgi:hypothetical protein
MNVSMRFEGGDRLARVLQSMPSRVSKNVMRDALKAVVAPPIRDRASSIVRRAPGAPDIADNIVVSNGRGDAMSVAVVVGPSKAMRSDSSNRSYAVQGRLLEFGFRGVMFPWLRPAFEQTAPGTLRAFAGEMWSALIRKGFGSTRTSGGGGGLL